MIIGLQISALIFSFTMIYFAVIHYKKGTLNAGEIFLWVILWSFAVLAVVFPDLLRVFARTFLFSRLFDLMVFGGFFLVIVLAAKSYITTKKLEKKLENMVRKEALYQANAKRKSKKEKRQ
jgi:hypothetical protein